MMSKIWVGMVFLSIICATMNGRIGELSAAVTEGASASINLVMSIGGMILLWSGIMEVMRRCGLAEKLTKLLTPVLRHIFPSAKNSPEVMGDIAANVSANLLGLGNAATPAGIRAAEGLHRLDGRRDASDDLCMLIVINTASLQLIPTTVAAVRASLGAVNPFDILPAVWTASVISQTCGILSARFLSKLWKRSKV
ncbi:MAG: spore maturation protein A [Oscillospiraceae bacterium]|nr:spore maturation protein A [Oscillospiraceae bacterium]MBQ4544651.1 spore maturation protein A [Oscillospiraceae bacterium]MBQ6902253.1 spore maturation protein A [Oscillospiraceae bacterium]